MGKFIQNNETQKKWKKIILLLGFLVYAGFNLFLLNRHQPYRDEANVWLMVKYLSPIELLREIHYQAHPCLWYFLVMPFAKLGFPYRTIEVLSFLIMLTTAAIFLMKARVHSVVKLLCLASPFFTYFYPVIARNYCLIALIMMLCAWMYPLRNEKPYMYGLLLGLLVQADSIAIAMAGALSFAWFSEAILKSIKQKNWKNICAALKGLWIPLVSLLFWVMQIRGVSANQAYEEKWQGFRWFLQETKNFSWRILERVTGWKTIYIITFVVIFLCVCIYISFITKTWTPLFVMIVSYLFQAGFSVVFHELHIWHFLSLGFVMMWMLWILGDKIECMTNFSQSGKAAVWAADVLVIVLICCMIGHWNSEQEPSNLDRALHAPYSDGYQTACFVRENLPEDALIITTDVALGSSVLAYLDGYQFYYAGSGMPVTYATWSKEQLQTISFEELDAWVRATFSGLQEYYVLQTRTSCIEDSNALEEYEKVYETLQETTKNEDYIVYRVIL